jgi:hypothetical protein
MTNLNNETSELSVDELEIVAGGGFWERVEQAAQKPSFWDRVSKQTHPGEDGRKA